MVGNSKREIPSLVVTSSDSSPDGLRSVPDATKCSPIPCLNWGGGDRWCHHLSSLRELHRAISYCPLHSAQGQRHLAPRHDEFCGPRSDYVRLID
ncbi:hypothetical protein TNCV_62551 [Trichonephila clavipes]|nr:hypothetical protein TNCV_62551 [Trichonephila clavipes]